MGDAIPSTTLWKENTLSVQLFHHKCDFDSFVVSYFKRNKYKQGKGMHKLDVLCTAVMLDHINVNVVSGLILINKVASIIY